MAIGSRESGDGDASCSHFMPALQAREAAARAPEIPQFEANSGRAPPRSLQQLPYSTVVTGLGTFNPANSAVG